MISAEDSLTTYEYPDYFKILPSINGWGDDPVRIKDGRRVEAGFVYASDTNEEWMSDQALKDWIDSNHGKIGAI